MRPQIELFYLLHGSMGRQGRFYAGALLGTESPSSVKNTSKLSGLRNFSGTPLPGERKEHDAAVAVYFDALRAGAEKKSHELSGQRLHIIRIE